MAMVYAGARGNTFDQMHNTLKFGEHSKVDVVRMMGDFSATMNKGSDSVILKSANRLYPDTGPSILPEYISMISRHFDADIEAMDYKSHPEEARKEINAWVETKTDHNIKDLLPEDSISKLTKMVIVNAIHFKGNWDKHFDKVATKMVEFHAKGEKVKVNMMHKTMQYVQYVENSELGCKVIELPYEGKDLGMIIVLPNSDQDLEEVEKQLTLESLTNFITSFKPDTVEVALPKFKLESSFELKQLLSALGMPDLFNENIVDLTDMGAGLCVSDVFHKAFVEVTEEGTEASAATAAIIYTHSTRNVRRSTFIADHPFLFTIWDHRTNSPLFVGRFVKPPQGQYTNHGDEL